VSAHDGIVSRSPKKGYDCNAARRASGWGRLRARPSRHFARAMRVMRLMADAAWRMARAEASVASSFALGRSAERSATCYTPPSTDISGGQY
jgi:hypothetical protein